MTGQHPSECAALKPNAAACWPAGTITSPPKGLHWLVEQPTVSENTVCSSLWHLFSSLCSPNGGVAGMQTHPVLQL